MSARTAADELDLYTKMLRIRLFEEQVNDLYTSAKMPGLAHLYIGEEAVAVGVCTALRDNDYITSTHRGHGHCLAKGAAVDRMFAELLGKEAGYCRGKGGSMHIADQERGNLGANAIVAGSVGIATGAALSAKKRGTDQVAVCFFGEGALGQGILYECMNMAALRKLPFVNAFENNMYNEYTHYSETTAGDIATRAKAFGIPFQEIDGQDVRAVHQASIDAVERARSGGGPSFLMFLTYRQRGHHVGDVDRSYYRSKDEERTWAEERDPVKALATALIAAGSVDAAAFDRIEEELRTEMRPLVDIMFGDFLVLALDQIANQAAKVHYMSGGKLSAPMVIRTTLGATRRSAAQHSQSLHALVSHIPGLKVALPSTPYDAKGLMIAAIRDDNPVVIFEDKMMYTIKGDVPEEDYVIPLGQADIKREGS